MSKQLLQIIGAAGPRVDGIDVAQLLRDLGEASAAASAVDLFGLCLNAQRVLERIQATGVGSSPAETALLATYRTMNDDGQDRLCSFAWHLQKRFPRRQPTLTLVERSRGGVTASLGATEQSRRP